MSTKIYNAYEIKTFTTLDLSDFIKTIRDIYIKNVFYPNIKTQIINEIDKITTKTLIEHHLSDKNETVKDMFLRYNSGYSDDDINNYSVIRTIINTIEKRILDNDNGIYVKSHSYDYDADICFFTYQSRQFMIAYGPYFTALFNDNKYADIMKPVIEKYGIKDFHYQNQTDQPDNISDLEWEERRYIWDVLLPTGIPSRDGVSIKIADKNMLTTDLSVKCFDIETYTMFLDEIINELIKNRKSIEDYANEFVRTDYINKSIDDFTMQNPDTKLSISTYSKFFNEYSDKLQAKDLEILDKIENVNTIITVILLDFNNPNVRNDISKLSIVDFLNKYNTKGD